MHRVIVAVVLGALPLAAQAPSKATLIADWQRDSANVVAYAGAMPDSGLEFHPTSGVRTFAGQIDHIVADNSEAVARVLKGQKQAPALGDSTKYLHDKRALLAYVGASYEYALGALRAATPAQLDKVSAPFQDQKPQSGWRWMWMAHEHSVWTLGQTVPYLRLNGATPPAYSIPF